MLGLKKGNLKDTKSITDPPRLLPCLLKEGNTKQTWYF